MLAKLLFRPLGIFFGSFVAGKVGNRAFDKTWERRHGTQAPTSTTEDASWRDVLLAAAFKGSLMAVSAAAFNRFAAKGFRRVTGFWPGEKEPEPAKRIEPRSRG